MQQNPNLVNRRLGNYLLTQRLGKGGFAEVYLGEHIHLKTQVAVKVLLTQLTQEAVETFRREAQMIAHLRHPSIVQVHDFGIEDDTAYLVMDYAPHGTLRQHQPKGTVFPLITVVSYVRQVAEGLQYAHDQRLIHRDVKPENMLLGPQQEVLLSDFGIALTAHSTFSQNTQNIAGTIVYMAPEQIQGHARPASDQYSLGIVVYEWLCGRRPFQGTFTEVAVQHVTKPPPSLRQYLPQIPIEIEQVVMTALQKDPQQRFPAVRAFAREFEQACLRQNATAAASMFYTPSPFITPPTVPVLTSQPLQQNTPPGSRQDSIYSSGLAVTPSAYSASLYSSRAALTSPTYPTPFSIATNPPQPMSGMLGQEQHSGSFSRRKAMVGIVGLVAASSGLTWFVLSHRISTQITSTSSDGTSSTSSTPLIPVTASLLTYKGHTDDVSTVDWSPNKIYIATAAQDGTAQVWTADGGQHLFTYTSQNMPALSANNANAIRWSPDSRRIVVGFDDGTAQGVDVMSKKELFNYGDTSTNVNAVAWSPNGNAVALALDGTVKVYDVTNGKMITRFTGHLNTVRTVAWSHDGKHIASGGNDTTVQVWSAATGQPLFIFKQYTREVSSVAWSADDSRIVSCGLDNKAMIWDLRSNRPLLTYAKHKGGWLNAVAWSPDGRLIATGGEVGTVTGNVYIGTAGFKDVNMHVWEAATGNTHAVYETLPVNGLVWSPDGSRIATACTNGIAQIWRVP